MGYIAKCPVCQNETFSECEDVVGLVVVLPKDKAPAPGQRFLLNINDTKPFPARLHECTTCRFTGVFSTN